MTSLEELEARIRKVEDIEAIRHMKFRYCYAYDNSDFEQLMTCFARDCRVDLGLNRIASGKVDVEAMFRKLRTAFTFSAHMSVNPLIDVHGDSATGTWYVFLPNTRYGEALWTQARYSEEYVREEGAWKIRSEQVTMNFSTPYDQGWVKQRVAQGLVEKYAALMQESKA